MLLRKSRPLFIMVLSLIMLLFSSSLVFAAGVPNSFKNMTGSGKMNVMYYNGFEDVTVLGNFNFNLNNLRVDVNDPTKLVANFTFTLKIPIYNKQNQQGNYSGYDVVYALVSVKDTNVYVKESSIVNPSEPLGPSVPTYFNVEISGTSETAIGTISIIGDGNIIDKYTGIVPLDLFIYDSRTTSPDYIFGSVDGFEIGMIDNNGNPIPQALSRSAIVTNVYTVRNQNQQ